MRLDTSLIPGKLQLGFRDAGVLGSAIPATGTHAPAAPYNSLSLPADAGKRYHFVTRQWPASGALFVYEDGSYSYAPVADGSYTFSGDLYEIAGGVKTNRGAIITALQSGQVATLPHVEPPAQSGGHKRGRGRSRTRSR